MLQFVDFYAIMNEIEKMSKKYNARIREEFIKMNDVRKKQFYRLNLNDHKYKQELIDYLLHCRQLGTSSNETSPPSSLGQALAARCMLDVFYRVQDVLVVINARNRELNILNNEGISPYYGREECERMISLFKF